MRDMVPIQIWWFILDVQTRRLLHRNPDAPLSPKVAARIHDAGGVLSEGEFFSGTYAPGYELLPEDITWIQNLHWAPSPPAT